MAQRPPSASSITPTPRRLFDLSAVRDALPRPVSTVAKPVLEKALNIRGLNDVYDAVNAQHHARLHTQRHAQSHTQSHASSDACDQAYDFAATTLDHLGLTVMVSRGDLEHLPRTGPVIAVSNHPFGGIEGLILARVLSRVRPDAKLLANRLLAHIPEMRPLSIFVDPFGGPDAARSNISSMKQSMQWLRQGHVLGVFPSGEVSSLRWNSRGKVVDPAWSPHIAALAKRTGARVVPMNIKGSNSALFQLAGLIHPRLRTALLPREFLNKRQRVVRVQLGHAVPAERLAAFETDELAIAHLRLRSELLGQRRRLTAKQRSRENLSTRRHRDTPTIPQAIASPIAPALLQDDLDALPPQALIVQDKNLSAYLATAKQLPHLLPEIGRLRELTFRAVGEGSGKARDLDAYDAWYRHLILWNKAEQRVTGAYRLGITSEILPVHGVQGLYLSSLFDIDGAFADPTRGGMQGSGIEMGRAFVCKQDQRSFAPMLMLWKAICATLHQGSHRYLFGPMSISNSYSKLSKALMVRYLSRPEFRSDIARLVQPRYPFAMRKYGKAGVTRLARQAEDVQELSQLVSDIEPDGKGFPILIRQYLNFNPAVLAFNVDPDFNHCLDCFGFADLTHAPARQLSRYMGKAEYEQYMTAVAPDASA